MTHNRAEILEMTADIVSAYVGSHELAPEDISPLLVSVFHALQGLESSADGLAPPQLTPAVPIKKSITPEFIICLEDGKKFKSLRRHLRTRYNMTPEEYRAKWGLPPYYPMVAPNYAQARSDLAKRMRLGHSRRG